MKPDIIFKFFDSLSERQREQFAALGGLYADLNAKINVISRKDIDNLFEHHVLHSLAVAAFLGEVNDGTRFVDVGTGGGFPAVPLAIFYPQAKFHLVDRIGKKLRVAREVSEAIGLENVTFRHGDMGECHEKFDFAVSRAVMPLPDLVKIVRKNIVPGGTNRYKNGLICLKGGDLDAEKSAVSYPVIEYPVGEFFNLPFFETKSIIYVPF